MEDAGPGLIRKGRHENMHRRGQRKRGQRGGARGHTSRVTGKLLKALGGHLGPGGQRTCVRVRPHRVFKSGSCRDVTQGEGNTAVGGNEGRRGAKHGQSPENPSPALFTGGPVAWTSLARGRSLCE